MRLNHKVQNNKKIVVYIYDIDYILSKNSFMRLKLKPNNIHMKQLEDLCLHTKLSNSVSLYLCTSILKLKKKILDNFELKFWLGPFELY